MTPQVSIVMPVYNRTDELRRALDSVANQSMGDLECIVVDACSDSLLEPIVNSYDSWFIYNRTHETGGPSAARIVGYERMQGQYLLQLDSDNQIFPWTLDRATRFLESEPAVSGVAEQGPGLLFSRVSPMVQLVIDEPWGKYHESTAACKHIEG